MDVMIAMQRGVAERCGGCRKGWRSCPASGLFLEALHFRPFSNLLQHKEVLNTEGVQLLVQRIAIWDSPYGPSSILVRFTTVPTVTPDTPKGPSSYLKLSQTKNLGLKKAADAFCSSLIYRA
jgi:hypothetical protein